VLSFDIFADNFPPDGIPCAQKGRRRASGVFSNQQEAIARIEELNQGDHPDVEMNETLKSKLKSLPSDDTVGKVHPICRLIPAASQAALATPPKV